MPPSANKGANGNTCPCCDIERVKMYPIPAQNKLAQVKPFASHQPAAVWPPSENALDLNPVSCDYNNH